MTSEELNNFFGLSPIDPLEDPLYVCSPLSPSRLFATVDRALVIGEEEKSHDVMESVENDE